MCWSPSHELQGTPSVRVADMRGAEEVANLFISVGRLKHGVARAAVGMITAAGRSDVATAAPASLHCKLPHELIVRDSIGAPLDKAVAAARRRR